MRLCFGNGLVSQETPHDSLYPYPSQVGVMDELAMLRGHEEFLRAFISGSGDSHREELHASLDALCEAILATADKPLTGREREYGTLRDRCVHSPRCMTLDEHDARIASPVPTAPALDVERLARAMALVYGYSLGPSPLTESRAVEIAAEYAALSPHGDPGTEACEILRPFMGNGRERLP
jgi:hypothetical protein